MLALDRVEIMRIKSELMEARAGTSSNENHSLRSIFQAHAELCGMHRPRKDSMSRKVGQLSVGYWLAAVFRQAERARKEELRVARGSF
jgi:hypothetical protein